MKAELTLPRRPTALYMIAVLDSLVLLLVFFLLVTGARQESGIYVDQPESDFRLSGYDRPVVVTVMSGVEPAIFIGRERVAKHRFALRLEEISEESGSDTVYLRSDEKLSVGVERELIEAASKVGLRVALVGKETGSGEGVVPNQGVD